MRRWRGNYPAPLDGRELAQRRAAATCRLQRMFSSCRSSPPLPAAPVCSGRRPGGIAYRQPCAIRAASPWRCLCWRSSSVRREPSGRAWPPSSPSSPPMRCPGSGAPVLPSVLGLEALASALAIARDQGVSAFRPGGGEPSSSANGNLLASHLPRRGHLYSYKGTRGARIVSARKGELMRSFRRAQVRACATWDEASRFIRRRRAD